MRKLFDAHLDLAWNALSFDRDLTLPLPALRAAEAHLTDHPSRGHATISLPELRKAGVSICVATLLARSGPVQAERTGILRTALDYNSPLTACAVAHGQLAYYRLLDRAGLVRIIRSRDDLLTHRANSEGRPPGETIPGLILSMEGTDPLLSPDQALDWWKNGLRAAGLAHYGRSRHAYGTGVDGPLSREGVALLKRFDELGIILDVTHLSDTSMAEALDRFHGPVLASHHNSRTLVPGDRQLSDAQVRRLAARGAVIGVAFDAWMLYPGWIRGETPRSVVGLSAAADQIDHYCQLIGSAGQVGIGSDLDGGFGSEQTPEGLESIADLQKLSDVLDKRGYTDAEIEGIFFGNWYRFYLNALPSTNPGREGKASVAQRGTGG